MRDREAALREVLKTNNPVLLDYARVLLADAGIGAVVFDTHTSVIEGSLGILPRRLMVPDEQHARAETLLREGLSAELPTGFRDAEDRFLDGRLIVHQPETGFRSGLDAVMLAATVPARAGDSVLELGSGAGVASLCLAARVPGCTITGLEIDPALADIATGNAHANELDVRFAAADAFDPPAEFKRDYTHVFCNPPFHGDDGASSPDAGRALALRDKGRLGDWLARGLKRTVSNGSFTTILRADRLGEALASLPAQGVRIFPLWPKQGVAAKRVILSVRKDSRAPLELLSGLVLHEADGTYTEAADEVLRSGKGLNV
jgi:tRNA1Val (adenine37-N6)-methyltransferase